MEVTVMSTRTKQAQRGQGMTEYIIIVALIAVAAIGAYSWFGQSIRAQTAGIAQEVAGNDASAEIATANTAASSAVTAANTDKGLANYNDQNNQQGAGAGGD
jgi:Flp pilus assembly pilin Flp